jgi:hypothetical protein
MREQEKSMPTYLVVAKTNREIRRCLVRYVAGQLYRLLEANPGFDPTRNVRAATRRLTRET